MFAKDDSRRKIESSMYLDKQPIRLHWMAHTENTDKTTNPRLPQSDNGTQED